MKKIFQLVLVYVLGIVCVLSFIWRASSLDKKNSMLASNYYNEQEIINY